MVEIGRTVDDGKPVELDIDFAIDNRILLTGVSRCGKSRGARKVFEKSVGKIQQIIISPKREYVTLREEFNFMHVGRSDGTIKPDIEINTKYAEQLALDILKIGVDVIIEFSNAYKERIEFVKLFIESLMSAPQELLHPVMIAIDEIDIWAGEEEKVDSLNAVIDLASRGSDKGFFLFAITQKLTQLSKKVAAELNIKIIGQITLDNYQERAAKMLGFPTKNKTVFADLGRPNYHFYAYGPGLSDKVIKMKFDDPITSHIPSWKLNKDFKPIKTPDAIAKVISAFSNLAQEAETELKTKEDMKTRLEDKERQIIELKTKLANVRPVVMSPTMDSKKLIDQGYEKGFLDSKVKSDEKIKDLEKIVGRQEQNMRDVVKIIDTITQSTGLLANLRESISDTHTKIVEIREPASTGTKMDAPEISGADLSNPSMLKSARLMVAALKAVNNIPLSKARMACMIRISVTSSNFSKGLAELSNKKLIEKTDDEKIKLTILGLNTTVPEESQTFPRSSVDTLKAVSEIMTPKSARLILEQIWISGESTIGKLYVANRINISVTSSNFSKGLAKLRKSGIIDSSKESISLTDDLRSDI